MLRDAGTVEVGRVVVHKYYDEALEEQAPKTMVWNVKLQKYEDDKTMISILLWERRVPTLWDAAKKMLEGVAGEER